MSIAKRLSNYDDKRSIGSRFRARRSGPLLGLIQYHFDKGGRVNILDIGGERSYCNIVSADFLLERNVHITIVNLPGKSVHRNDSTFSYLDGDACCLDNIDDAKFDIAHSNSVVEHVGDWDRMTKFAIETRRVAQSIFVQTPSYWFPIEPHFMRPFFHWLPKPVRVAWVQRVAVGHFKQAESVDEAVSMVESVNLVDQRMFSALFPDAEIIRERIFFLTKSYIALRR